MFDQVTLSLDHSLAQAVRRQNFRALEYLLQREADTEMPLSEAFGFTNSQDLDSERPQLSFQRI